jgi:hypothetical protein
MLLSAIYSDFTPLFNFWVETIFEPVILPFVCPPELTLPARFWMKPDE